MHEQEVEREVELVVAAAVVRDQLVEVEHVRLPHQRPLRLLRVRQLAPAAQHVVHLRPVHREHAPEAELLHLRVVVLGHGGVVAQLAVLDDRVADVDPPAGDAARVPEAQDLVERVAHLVVPPVEVRLARQEVVQVVLAGRLVQLPGRAAEVRQPVVRRPAVRRRVGPDVEVAVARVAPRRRVDEPRVAVARVVRDQVEQHRHVALAARRDERVEVRERAEVGMDVAVVRDVVAPVVVRRRHRRVEPDPVDPEPLEVVEPVDDPAQVADPVAVGVRERARVDLIENAVAPPSVSHRHGAAAYVART